jgi:hypothetical protein
VDALDFLGTRVVVGGTFNAPVAFGDGSNPLSTAGDMFIATYNIDITQPPTWVRTFGGAESDGVAAVAIGQDGNVVATGSFDDQIDFDGNVKIADGIDVFVVSLSQ